MCRDDCRCISMNYIHNKQQDNCELNDVNKDMKPAAVKYKPGESYYDLVREYKTDVSAPNISKICVTHDVNFERFSFFGRNLFTLIEH